MKIINSLSSFYYKFFEKITILKTDKITINIQITLRFEISNTPICYKKHFLHWACLSVINAHWAVIASLKELTSGWRLL
jgi:hypothetical protein